MKSKEEIQELIKYFELKEWGCQITISTLKQTLGKSENEVMEKLKSVLEARESLNSKETTITNILPDGDHYRLNTERDVLEMVLGIVQGRMG